MISSRFHNHFADAEEKHSRHAKAWGLYFVASFGATAGPSVTAMIVVIDERSRQSSEWYARSYRRRLQHHAVMTLPRAEGSMRDSFTDIRIPSSVIRENTAASPFMHGNGRRCFVSADRRNEDDQRRPGADVSRAEGDIIADAESPCPALDLARADLSSLASSRR